MAGSYSEFWLVVGMIAVAVTAANMSPTKRIRSITHETASRSLTPETDNRTAEKPAWTTAAPVDLPKQPSVEKNDPRVVVKRTSVDEQITPRADEPVPDSVEAAVPALEPKEVLDQREDFTPEKEEVASADSSDLIGTVKEALGTNGRSSFDGKANDAGSMMLTITNLNMRSGPGADYPSVQVLGKGLRVKASTDTGGKWIKIEIVSTGVSGWVNRTYLRPEASAFDGIAVAP